jgi:glycosyltransferase involved in cell wall biosynthesis
MRILMLVLNQTGKGTYWRAYHFGRCLALRGHNVTLLATSRRRRAGFVVRKQDGITIVETPDLLFGSLRSGWDPWNTYSRNRWLKGKPFDLVHAFEARPTVLFPALSVKRQCGATLVMDWADWFGRGGSVEERPSPLVRGVLSPVETFFEEHFRTRADGTTVINTLLRQRVISLGVKPASILLIRNGCDVSFQPLDTPTARQLLGLPLEPLFIGYVGNAFIRDAQFMAHAFNEVHKREPRSRLLLVDFNRSIEQWIEDPRAVLRIEEVRQSEFYPYLCSCDLCWLPLEDSPANRGRWPLKLNIYMTAGRPVLATSTGDLGEVIPRYQLGEVVPPHVRAFSDMTLALLENKARRISLGAAARQAAEGPFNWETLAAELDSFYNQVLQIKKP